MNTCAYHPASPAVAYCRTCGKPLCEQCKREVRGVVYCEACIAARLEGTAPPPAYAGAPSNSGVYVPPGVPNPTLAAFLGLIPGVGAFYNGQYQKGIVHVLMFPALIMLTDRVSDVFGVLFPFYFFYMMWDAYKTAKSRITGEPVPDPLGINNMFGLDGPGAAAAAAPGVNAAGEGVPVATPRQPALGNAPIGAFILIGLGVLFLLGDISQHFLHQFWPVILIVVGLWRGYVTWTMAGQPGKDGY
jgi:hypothetical protein